MEDAPPALAELPALAINGSFEQWSALVPAGCSAPWMDVYTSWCSSSAAPDGWRVRTGPAWGVLLNRWWESPEGVSSPGAVRHALQLRGGCSTPTSYTYCLPTALEGPAVALPAETASLRITEHPSGATLNDLLTVVSECRRWFSPLFTLYVGAQVASALESAHTGNQPRPGWKRPCALPPAYPLEITLLA